MSTCHPLPFLAARRTHQIDRGKLEDLDDLVFVRALIFEVRQIPSLGTVHGERQQGHSQHGTLRDEEVMTKMTL